MTTYEGIKRTGPPQAVQKLRDDLYLIQIATFGNADGGLEAPFLRNAASAAARLSSPRVDISGTFVRFRSDVPSVAAKTAWIDRWIERANQKEGAMGGKLDEERRRRRDEHQREQEELAAINAAWEKL